MSMYEPGLQELLASNLEAKRLTFTTSVEDGLRGADIVFLCVGTPSQTDGRADLSQVDEVVRTIAPAFDGYKLIVEKSTVPVNTACCIDRVIRKMLGSDREYEVANNPEFLREGSAVQDFLHPDRIVIGADSGRARALLLELYQGDFHCPIVVTSVKMAELIKHAANAFLATKISFINMVSDLCGKVGGDVSVVANAIGLDHRIGPHFLHAGLGFLKESGIAARVYDPRAAARMAAIHPPDDRLSYVESAYEATQGAHALMILTDWDEFRSLDLARLRSLMLTPVIIDGRNLYDPTQMRESGFEYYSLGCGDMLLAPITPSARTASR